MNDIVDELVRKVDKDTAEKMTPGKVLHLYGSKGSRYLKGVKAKAEKMGAAVQWLTCPPPVILGVPYVVDKESYADEESYVIPDNRRDDLDCTDTDGLSCTAEACLWILQKLKAMDGKNVCVIGRGHAVQRLTDALLGQDATVTVCHSKTKDPTWPALWADVIVNSAPTTQPIPTSDAIVLDISGGMERWSDCNVIHYFGPRDIGRLNTALLINRLAKR